MKFPADILARHLAALATVQRTLKRWWPPLGEAAPRATSRATPTARREIASIQAFLDSGDPATPQQLADCRRRIAMYAARRAPRDQAELSLPVSATVGVRLESTEPRTPSLAGSSGVDNPSLTGRGMRLSQAIQEQGK